MPEDIPYRAFVNGGAFVVAYVEDTLLSALRIFRAGIEAEFEHYDRREHERRELKRE